MSHLTKKLKSQRKPRKEPIPAPRVEQTKKQRAKSRKIKDKEVFDEYSE